MGSSVRSGGKSRGGGLPAGSKSEDEASMESKAQPATGVEKVDESQGVVEALVSVTGVLDGVGDVIEPGAYTKTLAKRTPRGVWSHAWSSPVSKTLDIKELMPGDPDLPKELSNGEPWPAGAGALWVRTKFNLGTPAGKDAFSNVKFFSEDTGADTAEWSIGYKTVKSTKDKDGTRRIKELDLYEYSPVLHGANPHAKTLAVKSLDEALEALHEGGYDTTAIENEVKTVESQAPDPEGLTLAEIKQVVMARDILDAWLDAAGEAAGYGEKRAAPVGDPDLEEPDESWLDDEGHDSSDAEDDGDYEVIPTLASRLEEVLDENDYADLLDAADAFDEAVGAMDDDAISEAVEGFLSVFEAEEADDPEDVDTWDGLREIVGDTFDEANYHVYGIVPGEGDEEPDDAEGDDDADEYEDGEGESEDDGEPEGEDAPAAEGAEKSQWADELKGIPKAERDKCAANGTALADGSFPIRSADELSSAIGLRHQGNAPNKVVDDHIKKRARALKKTHMLPEDMRDGGADDASEGKKPAGTKSEPFTLPPMDWADRAAFDVIPAINF